MPHLPGNHFVHPFCSPYWNRMRRPLFSFHLSPSHGHWRWEMFILDQEWTLPRRQSVRKSQPSAAPPMMTARSHPKVRHCNWENILQIAVLADCCSKWCPSCSTMAFVSERLLEGSVSWSGITGHGKEQPSCIQSLAFHFTHRMSSLQQAFLNISTALATLLTCFIFDVRYFSKRVNQVTLSL